MTIDPESYEIERVADFVLDPSYEVYGRQEDVISNPEPLEDETTIRAYGEHTTAKRGNTMNESTQTNKVHVVEQKNFKMSVRGLLRDARANEDVQARLDAMNEILTYFDDVDFAQDLKEEVEIEIDALNEQIRDLARKGEALPELEEGTKNLNEQITVLTEENASLKEEVEALTGKYEDATELLDSLKVFANKVRSLYESMRARANGMIKADEYQELLAYVEEKEVEINDLKEQLVEARVQAPAKAAKKEELRNARRRPAPKMERKTVKRRTATKRRSMKEGFVPPSYAPKKTDTLLEDANTEVALYYQDLEGANPRVVKIRKEILGSKTLMEAQMTYLRLKGLIDDDDMETVERRDINRIDSGDKELMKEHQVAALSRREAPAHKDWI